MSDARPVLVIGYGNTIRGDDAVGPRAADAVSAWKLPGVTAMAVEVLTPELAEPLGAARLVVFVDARLTVDGDSAAVEVSPLDPMSRGASALGHASDPPRLLGLARDLYGNCPRAWLVTVPAADLSPGEGLSDQAQRGLDLALREIAAILGKQAR